MLNISRIFRYDEFRLIYKQDRWVLNMPIVTKLDVVLADRKMPLKELASKVGISPVNLSHLKVGKSKAVRFSTLDGICEVLHCQPGDILVHVPSERADDETAHRIY